MRCDLVSGKSRLHHLAGTIPRRWHQARVHPQRDRRSAPPRSPVNSSRTVRCGPSSFAHGSDTTRGGKSLMCSASRSATQPGSGTSRSFRLFGSPRYRRPLRILTCLRTCTVRRRKSASSTARPRISACRSPQPAPRSRVRSTIRSRSNSAIHEVEHQPPRRGGRVDGLVEDDQVRAPAPRTTSLSAGLNVAVPRKAQSSQGGAVAPRSR